MPELDEFGIPKKTTTPVDEFGIPVKKKDGGLSGTTTPSLSSPSVSPLPSVGSFGFDQIKKLVDDGLRPRQDNLTMPSSVKKSVAKFEQEQAQAETERVANEVSKNLGIDKQIEAKNKIKQEQKAKVQKAADDLYETPIGKFYYQVLNPLATAGGKGLSNTLTGATRLIGSITNNEEVANKISDHINENLNPQYRWDNTLAGTQPKKLQGSLFNDGKVNASKIVPSTVETLTNMAFLLGGTKGLGGGKGALVTSSYINSLQGYRDAGTEAGLKGESLDNFANISAVLEGTLELVSPNDIALGNLKTKLAKSYAKEIAKGVTVRQATRAATKEFIKEVGKENIQELSQTAKDKIVRLITDKVSDTPVFNDDLSYNGLKDEVLETMLLTSISTGLISAPNSIASAKPSTYEKSIWYTAAKNPDKLMSGLNKEFEKGNITEEQYSAAKNNFSKYQSALNNVEKLGYSEDQAVKMAWSVFKGEAINKNNQAIKNNPVLNGSLGNEIKKQEQEVAQEIKLAGLGVPEVGSEINGTELSNVLMNTGDKGGVPGTQMIDGIKDNLYRVEEVNVKELYNNNAEFKKYVDEYQKKSQDADGLLIPAIIDSKNGIVDGRSRLAAQFLNGQDKVKVFKQLNEKTGPEVSIIDNSKVENIKNKFDFIKDEDFVEEAFTPEEDTQFRENLPDSGIANEQELTDLLEKGEYAMLTGQNPDAVAVSKQANAKLNEKAKAWLAERGLKPVEIFGKYGNSERSFLVPGMTKQQAVEFAQEFQQDSVAHSSGLVYKDGSYNPRTEGVNLEDRFDNGGDFFSTINVGGKKVDFSVNYDFDKKITPDNNIATELLRDVFGQNQDINTTIENVRKALESTGVTVEVVPDEAAFEGQVGGQRGLDGVFIAEDGKILLNEKRLKESAEAGRIIFHEGAHPVMNIIRNTNRELYDQVVAGLKEAANTNPEIAASLKWAQENYDIEDVQNDEAVIETIAKVGDGTLDVASLPTGFKQKLIDLINLISKALGFGQIVNDTDIAAFKKIAAEVAEALATGTDVAGVVGRENVTEYQNEIPSAVAAGQLTNDPQARFSDAPAVDVYETKETDKLPVKSISEVYDQFGGKAVAINSDPTRVGELTLPSGKKIFMYGGPAYLSLKDNVQAMIGFATTQLSKVTTWSNYMKQVFGDQKGVTLVATQAPTSMMANSYALRYVLDAISTLPKSVLRSKEFKDEFFGKDLVLLKAAFGEKGYNDFVNKYKKADLSDAKVIDGMISEMAYKVGDDNKPASFKARGAFVSNLLGGIALKSEIKGVEGDKGYVSKKPTKFIAKQLFDRLGLNQEKLFYELGEKSLVDLYMNEGKWGMAVAGFETEAGFDIEKTQEGGVKHPLFNAKFPGSNAFLLDGAYEIDNLFAPQDIISSGGNPYTKSAAQMLAGSMYVMGEETQGEKSFEYKPTEASAPRIQARKAPNGKPSNLNAQQYEQVRTPEFKAWFGDWENDPENASKVVDENGEPRVIFHGTNVKFDQFDKDKLGSKNWMADSAYTGFFFAGDEKTSQAYVGMNNADWVGLSLGESPILTSVVDKYKSDLEAAEKAIKDVSDAEIEKARKIHAKLIAPLVDKLRDLKTPESFIKEFAEFKRIPTEVFEDISRINKENGNNKRLNDVKDKIFKEVEKGWMKEKGLEPIILNLYLNIRNPFVFDFKNSEDTEGLTDKIKTAKLLGNDGVIFNNLADGAEVDDIFVAFEPNQIKSATDNSGAFSKTDNRIQARKSSNLVQDAKLDKKMTVDNNGNYIFYHYSANKFSKVDPNKFGSNTSATGRDERPGMGMSMFYTKPDMRESGVSGENGYIVRVPMDKVYPFNADPLNFYDEAKERFEEQFPGQAFEPNKQLSFITQVANENGFPMTVAKWNIKGRNALRAQTTEALKVEPLTEEAQNYKAQARKSALEESTAFKLAAFVMRKKAEGATNEQIATGIKSVMPSMTPQDIMDVVENPEGYLNKKFSYLSEDLRSNLIGRAKVQNIYKANPRNKGGFAGLEVEMDAVKQALQNNKKEQFKKAVQDWGKKWLTASKGLPDWVLAIKDKANGEKNFEVDRAARILTELKSTAKKIGFSDWDAFSKAMVAMGDQPTRQMSNSTDIAMYDPYRAADAGPALQDNELPATVPAEVKALPVELIPFVYQMRGTIDRLTKDLVSSGYVTPDQAAVLEKNIGQYVNRAYKLFNEKGYKPSEEILADAVKFIADQKFGALVNQFYNASAPTQSAPTGSKAVGQFGGNTGGTANIDYEALMKQAIEEAKKDVNAILDRKTNPYFNAKTESRNTGILQERQDIPEPIRKLMGEYTDPGTVFMMTVAKQSALRSASELLTTMRDKGMGTLFFEENDPNRPVSHSVKIASDTGETKAPLNGLYTTPQIAEVLETAEPTYNDLTKTWMKAVGAVRWGKTVGSVVTQFKNFESNLGFAVMNGMMFTGKNSQAFKGAAKYIKGQYTKGEVDALTEKVMKLGLVGQSVGARELAEMLNSGNVHDIALDLALNQKSKFNKVKDAAGMPFQQANKLYRLGDDFWKVYAYLNEREQLGKALFNESYDNLTPQQQEDVDTEASERVKSTWPTYDRIFEAAKYISKRAPIFGNFISFQAESLRVLANTVRIANKDMSSDNPDIQALGLRRMFGVTTYLGFRAAAVYAVAKAAGIAGAGILAQFGGDDEEKKKKRGLNKAMPPFMRTGDILPIQNEKEPWRYTVYNMSSIDPYGTIPNALNAATEGREGIFGKTMEPGVLSGLVEFFSGFMEPEMTFETTWSVMNNANIKTGDPIVLPTDNDGEAMAKVSKYLFDQLKPSTIDMVERLYERDNKSAELSAMAGARPYDVDLHKSFRYGLSDMMKQLEDINKLYNRVNYSTTATEQQKIAAEKDAETSKARLIQKMHETYQDFILLGADHKVLDEMISKTRGIKSTGFDLQTKKAIKSGVFDEKKLYKIKK